MADITHLRASSLPLAFLCPASVRPPALRIVQSNNAADLGTAVHEALRSLAETGRVDWDALPAIAERHGVGVDEMRFLCGKAAKLWPDLKDSFPRALTELELSAEIAPGVVLSGHVDLLSVSGRVARAADWKSGYRDSDYSEQMRAYGALVLLDDTTLVEVTITVIWLRAGEIENYTMTRTDAEAWVRRLLERVVGWDGAFFPGNHCHLCPRSHECAAGHALIRRDVAAIADEELVVRAENELERMPAPEVVAVLQKADAVARYAERVRQAIKKHVERHGDIIANGLRLTIDTETRRSIDVLKAWPVLDKHLSDEDLAECITVSISKAEKVVATRAGRGKGAAAVRALNGELDAAGAVEPKEVKRLVVKRA